MNIKVCLDIPGSVEQMNQFNLTSGGELTISSGAVTITHSVHTIDTEGGAAIDDLATINGGSAGDVVMIGRASLDRAVVLKHNVGNIKTPSGTDHELTALGFVILKYDGNNWQLQTGNGSGYLLNKLSCLTVATTNIDLADEQVINGVFCGETARVFLAGQTDKKENGPWDVVAAAASDPGAWTRPVDFQDGFSVSGHIFCIELGTQNAETVWMISNHYGEDIVGTDDLEPIQLNGDEFNINTLPAESTNSDLDLIAIYDTSAGEMRKQTRSEFLDGVSGGSGVTSDRQIFAGDGLSGGGDLSDDRTLNLDINGLTAESTANDADSIAIYDASAGEIRKQTRAEFFAGIGVTSSRTITAGVGLSGGGDLSDDRTLNLDINGLTAESSANDADSIAIYDVSAGEIRKQTRAEFFAGIGVTSSRTITAGVGLSGGGDLSDDRTLNLDINGLPAESAANNADSIAIYDASAGSIRKQTRAEFLNGITSGYVSTSTTVTAGLGLKGGGPLSGNISLYIDISEFSIDGTIENSDQLLFYDVSGPSHKRITKANLLSEVFFADGSRGMENQIVFTNFPPGYHSGDGAAAPQITKNNDTDSGFYFGSGGTCGLSVGGVSILQCADTVVSISQYLIVDDHLRVNGRAELNEIRMLAQSADPPALLNNSALMWISDGTGSGDAGDLMIKISSGGMIRTATLVDFSTL